MAKLNEDLLAALYMLGFNIYGAEVAEIKGEMSIKVLRRGSSKLNFVLTLPSHQEIVFTIDDDDIIATATDNDRGGAPSGARH